MAEEQATLNKLKVETENERKVQAEKKR